MAILTILTYPDPRLRIKAQPVATVDAEILSIVEDMFETMYESGGLGLAATQVNVHKQIFVMDLSGDRSQPYTIINPEIIHREGKQFEGEGCLSVLDAQDKVERALKIRVRGLDGDGKPLELEAEGLMAACIQHETDHLNGVLFVDHLSRLKQDRIRKKAEKLARA